VVPVAKGEIGPAVGNVFSRFEDEVAGMFAIGFATDAEVESVVEEDEVAGVVPYALLHAVPKEKGEAAGVWDGGGNISAGQLEGVVGVIAGEGGGVWSVEIVCNGAGDFTGKIVGGGVTEGSVEIVAAPVGEGLFGENGFWVVAVMEGGLAAGFFGEGFEGGEEGFDDLGFGLNFESGGAGRPGGVAAEGVLFGWGDVAGSAVREFEVDGGFEGAAGFEFQSGDGVDLVGKGGESEVADANGLEEDFFAGIFVKVAGLFGVNFGPGFGSATFHLGEELVGPCEAFLIGKASFESEGFLIHCEWRAVVIGEILESGLGEGDEIIGIFGGVADVTGNFVVHPVEVAAGALGHGADGSLSVAGELFGEAVGIYAEVVGGSATAVVVHGVIGEDGEGLAVEGFDGDERELVVDGSGGADVVWILITGMHHGTDGGFSEGIGLHLVGAGDPAAVVGEAFGWNLEPADAGGLDFFEGIGDPFGDFWRKEIGVSGVGHGTEAVVHGAGRGVGVGGGDEDVFGGNSGGLESQLLGPVTDVAGDHAAIDHGDRDESLIATEDEAAGLEIAGVHFASATFGEATIDEEGVEGRGDVLNVSSGFEGRFSRRGVIGREPEP